jgi:O-acetyl-ADP-ribose deacetylase (regulator of RNase III)
MINYIDGDVVKLAKEGAFDVVVHGCNCLSTMGAGVAPQMAKAFGCDKFEMEMRGPNIEKLGNIDYETLYFEDNKTWTKYPDEDGKWATIKLTVVNAYTQYMYGKNHIDGVSAPFDYEAFTICMRKMNHIFKGNHIGMPKIGSHLAGGDWNRIEKTIEIELSDCKVTVVNYKP